MENLKGKLIIIEVDEYIDIYYVLSVNENKNLGTPIQLSTLRIRLGENNYHSTIDWLVLEFDKESLYEYREIVSPDRLSEENPILCTRLYAALSDLKRFYSSTPDTLVNQRTEIFYDVIKDLPSINIVSNANKYNL